MEVNPYEWPSLENLGVMVHKNITKGYSTWWLEAAAGDGNAGVAEWQAYEKLDGTNVAMVASTGSLLGRHFKIADDAATYQSAPLTNVRAHIEDVRAVERALLEMLPAEARAECQVVVYGELLVTKKHGYHQRTEPHQTGDWFIFGAGFVVKEELLNDVRAGLLQHGLAAKQSSKRVYIFLNDTFASLLQTVSAGKLRTPQPLCPPCTNLYDLITALEPYLTGTAALNTEGAILVGLQGQKLVEVFKYKTSHSDDSLSGEKLSQLLDTEAVTALETRTLKLTQAIHAVATAHVQNGKVFSGRQKQGEGNKGSSTQKQAVQGHPGFKAAFDSALTKLDAVTVWSASKELLDQAISYMTAQVKEDLVVESTTEKEVQAIETQVKKAVGQVIAASKKAKPA